MARKPMEMSTRLGRDIEAARIAHTWLTCNKKRQIKIDQCTL